MRDLLFVQPNIRIVSSCIFCEAFRYAKEETAEKMAIETFIRIRHNHSCLFSCYEFFCIEMIIIMDGLKSKLGRLLLLYWPGFIRVRSEPILPDFYFCNLIKNNESYKMFNQDHKSEMNVP